MTTIIDLVVGLVLWLIGFGIFGRFIAPRWKVFGKLIFYLAVTLGLSLLVGHWSLIWIIGHPLLGVVGHVWWCKKNGIHWLTCTPREKYLSLRPWASNDGFQSD